MAAGERVRYNGKCRDQHQLREGVNPVVRFKNPLHGEVVLDDQILGEIRVANSQLETPLAWAALLWLSMLGMILFVLVVIAEKVFMPWAHEGGDP